MNRKVIHELLNSYGKLEFFHEELCDAIRPKSVDPQNFADLYTALNNYKNAVDIFMASYFGDAQPEAARPLAGSKRSEGSILPDNVIYFKDRAKALQR